MNFVEAVAQADALEKSCGAALAVSVHIGLAFFAMIGACATVAFLAGLVKEAWQMAVTERARQIVNSRDKGQGA